MLRNGLKDERPSVIWNAAYAIRRIGRPAQETVPALTALLKHEDQQVRIVAAHALSEMGPAAKPAVATMAGLLKTQDGRQRRQVANALVRLGPDAREALPVLLEQLKDLEGVIPNPILVTLGNLGPDAQPAVPALVELLQKEKRHTGEILQTLGRIGPGAEAAVAQIVAFMEKSDVYDRARACRALGEIGPKAMTAVPALKKLREEGDAKVRIWAAFALARITGDSKPQVALIVELRKDERPAIAKGPDSKPPVDSVIKPPPPVNSVISYDAAQALELLGTAAQPARDLLLEALMDKKLPAGTHLRVCCALGQLRDDAGAIVPRLMAHIQEPAPAARWHYQREHAIEALGLLGPKATAALPLLRVLHNDENDAVAEAAAKAIEKIEAKTVPSGEKSTDASPDQPVKPREKKPDDPEPIAKPPKVKADDNGK